MRKTTSRPAKQSWANGFYWEESAKDTKKRLKAIVSIRSVSNNKLNDAFNREQSKRLRNQIQDLFRINRFHVNDEDAYNNLIWSLLSEYPPSHVLSIGYKLPTGEEKHSMTFFLSLQFLKSYNTAYVVQMIGRFIVSRIQAEQTSYCLQDNDTNVEYWLQCVRAVCKKIMERE